MMLLSWIYYYIFTMLNVVRPGSTLYMMQTLCTLYKQHTCSMRMQSKAVHVLSLHNNLDT